MTTDQPYYFAIKTADEVPNWSPISEIGLATPADVFAPEQVDDLQATDTTDTSVTLTWTAPGDDGATGTATSYDIRYVVDGTIDAANFATADPFHCLFQHSGQVFSTVPVTLKQVQRHALRRLGAYTRQTAQ